MRRLCDTLRRDAEVDFDPDKLTRLLKSFAEPFGEGATNRGFFALRPQTADSRYLKLLRNWQDIETIRARRMRLARALVQEFQRRRQCNTLLAMLVRHARDDEQGLQCQSWELLLPEIEYVPQ